MAKIFPFKGVLFNKSVVKDYGLVLTQPYDKIDEKMQDAYYRKHEFNIVRVTKGKEQPGDTDSNNKYTRAGEFINKWLKEGVLVQDKESAIYAYYQTFKDVTGKSKTRKGFIAVLKLEDFSKGGVHAHERTLAKPKQDRLNTMMAVGGSCGQIFMLYSDPKIVINKVMDSEANSRPADVECTDEYGETNKLWKITDEQKIKTICREMEHCEIFIADGHHRYETSLNYREEMRKRGKKASGNETFENRMMTFVNMDDEGLTIFPTQRLIFGLANFSFADFEAKLRKNFEVREYVFTDDASRSRQQTEMLEDLHVEGNESHCFGLAAGGTDKFLLLKLKDESVVDKLCKDEHTKEWKRLDVSILHTVILENMLGITKDKVEREENVSYKRHYDEAIKAALSGKCQMAFLLNPTKLVEVQKIAAKGERMPQKSTDFYPKLLTGMVISKISFV
jgi:uncharacterized protein (DUF1015 family)